MAPVVFGSAATTPSPDSSSAGATDPINVVRTTTKAKEARISGNIEIVPVDSDSSDDESFTTTKGPTTEDYYEADMAANDDSVLEAKFERVDTVDI